MTAIDFHIHSKKTSKAPFNVNDFINIIRQAKKQRLDCIAITEHAHAKNFNEAYDYLKKKYDYTNDYYLVDGIKVFIGLEVSVSEGFDIVCVDNRESIIQIQNHCPNKRGELSLSELFGLITREALVILAHPYRKHENIVLQKNILERIDAIEINANDLSRRDNKICNSRDEQLAYIEKCFIVHKSKIENLAYVLDKPAISGSDSHNYVRVGCIKTILIEESQSINQIKNQIKSKNFIVEFSDSLFENIG